MTLTSEQVHWIYGALLAAGAVLLILREYRYLESTWLDYVTPALLLLFGVEMLMDPLVHGAAVPTNYAKETAQHFALGLMWIGTAGAEILRLKRKGEGWPWRLPLAAALMMASGILALHAQHDSSAPMALLMAQHRVIAATLALASFASLVLPPAAGARPPSAFAVLILLLAVELLLYTEGRSIFGESLTVQSMDVH